MLTADKELAKILVQTLRLGIDLDKMAHLEKVLDVGCGQEANLVHFLRTYGAEAEGIDGLAVPNDYLIKGWVLKQGDIPRPAQHYNLVVVHSNPCLYDPRKDSSERDPERFSWQATRILMEMMRVTKKGGEVRVFPSIKFLDEKCERLGLRIEQEESPIPFQHEIGCTEEVRKAAEEMFAYRSILRRP